MQSAQSTLLLPFSQNTANPLRRSSPPRGQIVFVEVKCRSSLRHGPPRQAVGVEKMRRIIHAAQGFLAERALADRPVRFDVVEVRVERGGLLLAVEHITGAFGADRRGW